MKKLLQVICFLVLCGIVQAQTTYYVSPSGVDNSGRDGLSTSTAWATLSYACTRVSGTSTIYIFNGNYTWSSTSNLPVNTNIIGESRTGVQITVNVGGTFITLQTANGWLGTYGNQTISNITLNGNYIGSTAIAVNYRSNVTIQNCTIQNFQNNGVVFFGMPMASWGGTSVFEPDRSMPDYWCTNNKLLNCTLTNNVNGGSDAANVRVGQQDGLEIAYCTITQPNKGSNTNCGGIKFYEEGWCKNMDIHHNNIDPGFNLNNSFNFALEIWYILGGDKYHHNTLKGTIDIDCATKGSSGYSAWIYNNDIGYDDFQYRSQNGIDIEANCSDIIVEKNNIHHVSTGIYFSQIWPITDQSGRDNHPYNNVLDNITIRCNKILIGIYNGSSDWEPVFGILCGRDAATDGTSYVSNINIQNNVIGCSQISSDSYYTIGIWLPNTNTVVNYVRIYNNIIYGFTGGSYAGAICGRDNWGTSNDINYLYIYTNIMFSNGGYGNVVHFDSNYTVDYYNHDNPITTNPNLNSSFEITSESSSAYHAGTYIALTSDFNDNSWNNPPSIGACEYVTQAQPPSSTSTKIIMKGGRPVMKRGIIRK